MEKSNKNPQSISAENSDTAIFAAGCFWCVEAIFQRLNGVVSVSSGYTGGTLLNPGYKEVCTGKTGHAEAVRIIFDPNTISYDELLEVFWKTHDPTTLNRQGGDVGTQYRSAIFYTNKQQAELAESYKKKLEEMQVFDNPIVTEIVAFDGKFYIAEDYHQNYFNQNSSQPYCRAVIIPKLEKFETVFKSKIRK